MSRSPYSQPCWQSRLREYMAAMQQRHPEVTDLRIKLLRPPKWVRFPTGLWQFIVELCVSGTGYRTIRPLLYIEPNGRWNVR